MASVAGKLLEDYGKFHVVGKLDWEGVPLTLAYDSLDVPKSLNVVKNGKTIAKVKIPTSDPSDVTVLSGNLDDSEKSNVLKIFKSEIGGISGWESLLIAMDPLTSD